MSRGPRQRLFRILAITLGLLPFVGLEVALRLGDIGRRTEVDDPYVGFEAREHLFHRSSDGQRYEIAPARLALFRPASFSVHKSEHEFRIFCLGGSTVQGRPYATETAFPQWLELSLQAADPDREWKVINCGGVSYASYRLRPVMEELLDYEPDLFVIYLGHNEFLESRTYGGVLETPPLIGALHHFLSRLRVYNLCRSAWIRLRRSRSVLPSDAEPRLDFRGGLEEYERDDVWQSGVRTHFEFTLRQMLELAGERRIPLVVCNPVANLKDCRPFKSESGFATGSEQRSRAEQLLDKASQTQGQQRLQLLKEVVSFDRRNADAQYELGLELQTEGQFEDALAALLAAKDEDLCPLRIQESLRGVIRTCAAESNAFYLDAHTWFAARSPQGIPGKEWLLDHVHPTIEGHQRLAEQLVEVLAQHQLTTVQDGYDLRRNALYSAHTAGLPAGYHAAAQERIEGLRRWTEGRAFQVPKTPGFLQPDK